MRKAKAKAKERGGGKEFKGQSAESEGEYNTGRK